VIYADSSFLCAAYAEDAHTLKAREFLLEHQAALPFTFLHWPELAKYLWTVHAAAASHISDIIVEDLAERRKIYPHTADALAVGRRAAGLLRNFCPRRKKLRSLDALHVALAVDGNFKTFLSFDTHSQQRLLAHAQKLQVWPPLTADEKARL
jgi:predicted nucleic acid-binding protein